ncbi:MAG: DNA-binding protein [Candidatus Latescibacteria bacterium 4484_107]|nr:MAG: DNA-binding protein [Candidatus Latescibacteria bacterium 4484_107]
MTPITISLPEHRLLKLNEMATRLSVAPEALVRFSVEEVLSRPEEAFRQAADYVLANDAESYRRLA